MVAARAASSPSPESPAPPPARSPASTAKPGKAPPALPGLPLIGSIPQLQKDPLKLFSDARDELGDVVRMRFGPQRAVVLTDPALIQEVLVDKTKQYSKQTRGYDNLRKMLGNGLVTSEGDFWLRQRRIAQPAFHREKIAGFADVFTRDTREAIPQWRAQMAGDKPFDLAQALMQLTMRIAGETLFSVDVSGDTSRAGQAITELVHQVTERTFSLGNLPDFVPTGRNRRFQKANAVLDDLMRTIIAERRQSGPKNDLLSMLMDAVDEETGERMSDDQLKDEVLTTFSAGHETTANALAWTFGLLAQHPEIEQQLRREIDSVVGAGDVTMAHVMKMPLLDAVLKESMRLYPPVWLVVRRAEQDDLLGGDGGVLVKRGEYVFIAQWTVQRHPKHWKDPDAFKPERFLVEDTARHKYAYFPFLGGARKCIGDQFALLEMRLLLVALLQHFRFTLVEPTITPEPFITLRPKGGLWVRGQALRR